MTEEERAEFVRQGNAARTAQRKAREDAENAARMGLRGMLGARLEARADALTARLEGLALSQDDAIALRGIELWLSRVYGKAVQPTQELQTELPVDTDALEAMSTEERRALMRSLR